MDDLENPYRTPERDEPVAEVADWDDDVDPRTISKARQVPTVAILMIVHGVLMFVAACFLIGVAYFLMPQIGQQIEVQQEIQRRQGQDVPLPKAGMVMFMYAIYGGMAAGLVVIGVINIVAGILNRSYRNRIFGIISLIVSMGSVLFCWFLPFSLGLLIFGLIIYLSPEAERAFARQHLN